MGRKSPKSAASSQPAFFKYAGELHRFLKRRLGRAQDAEDVTQEIFMRVLRFDDTDFVRNPQAYLYGIASHVVREYRMRQEQEKERLEFDTRLIDEHDACPAEIEADAMGDQLNLQRQIETALDRLSPGHRAVLLCIKRDGLSYEETAKATGFTYFTVERYLFEALARIRTMRWDR